MKAKSFALSVAALALSLTTVAKADQWTDADALFVRRAEGPAVIEQARAKYKAILNAATVNQDKIRAASQLARLAVYHGEMLLPKSDKDGRKAIFADCWKGNDAFLEKISPAALGGEKTPQYYFFKGICLGYWGEAAGPILSLPNVPTIKETMREALALDTRFEGGGAHRLVAGVKSNSAARALPGLYDIDEAQAEVALALASAAYPGDANNGRGYYENLRTEAQVLTEAGKLAEAKTKMQEAIALGERAIRNNRLPAGREPESKWVIEKLKLELEQLNRQ
jgi:hypothetical protein